MISLVRLRLLVKQAYESFLLKVAVSRKRFGFALVAHQNETNGVAE